MEAAAPSSLRFFLMEKNPSPVRMIKKTVNDGMFTLSTGARLCPSSVSDVYNYNRHISYEKSDMLANHAATCLLF